MNLLKCMLDAISPKTPSQRTQAADQENIKRDRDRVDQSIANLKIATDDYAGVVTRLVTQVMHDVKNERSNRREKTSSRSGKT